jgi:transcriptional regulator with XRE-family HTH domain
LKRPLPAIYFRMKTLHLAIITHVRFVTKKTYAQLGRELNCSHTFIMKVENGNKRLTREKLEGLTELCGYEDMSELVYKSCI